MKHVPVYLTLCALPFILPAQDNAVWEEYSGKLEKRIPAYGKNTAKEVQERFRSVGEAMPENIIFRIPATQKQPKALFVTGRNYYRLLKGTGQRAGMAFDLAPYHYFSDSGYPRLPHLQNKKFALESDTEFLKLLNRGNYGLLVTGTVGHRNPLLLNKSLPEIQKKIRNGFCWLEIGDIKTSPILKLFPGKERKTPVYTAPDGTALFVKKIGKGKVGVLILQNQHNEGDYFRIYEAISIMTGTNPGVALTLSGNQFFLRGKYPAGEVNYILELYDPITKKRFSGKGNTAFCKNLKITLPENIPLTDYLATLSLFDRNGNYITGCGGNFSLSEKGKISEIQIITPARKDSDFKAKVKLKNHSGGTIELRLMDGQKRYLPGKQIKEIPAGTTAATVSAMVDYIYLTTNIGYAEITYRPADGKAVSVSRKLFTIPFSVAEQHTDYHQIMWLLPKDMNDLDSFMEHARKFGFNALCTGYYFDDSDYQSRMELLSRWGMPVHLEYIMADNSVFGNFGLRNKGNKHVIDLGNRYARRSIRNKTRHRAEVLSRFGIAGYACSEEIGLGVDETCFHPAVQYLFGKWSIQKYKTLDALNLAWGTDYTSEEQIKGVLLADVLKKKPESPGQWIDFRMFMEEMYNSLMENEFFGSFQLKAPGSAVGYNAGPYVDVPTQGLNAARLGKTINYAIEYLPGFLGFNMTLSSFDMLSSRKIPYLYSVVGYPNAYQKTDANYDFRIWYTLLHGGRGNAWFSTLDDDWYSKFTADGSPSGTMKMIAKSSEDARNGLGKFIIDSQKSIKAGIYYSRRSRYLRYYLQQRLSGDPEAVRKAEAALADAVRKNPGILDSSRGDSIGFALTDKAISYMKSLVEDVGERWDLVFEDTLLSGELEKNYNVLCLPAVMALSREEIAALERFVKNGGVIIADTMTGWFDENGNPNPERKRLDALFGLRRDSMTLPVFPKQNVKLKNGKVVTVYRGELITALPGAEQEENGVLIIHRTGKGKTLYLNGYFSEKKLHQLPEIPAEIRKTVKSLFPVPLLRTFSGSKETPGIAGVEISRLTCENTILYTFHRRFTKDQDNITELRFDRKYHLYDPRSGKYLGYTDRLSFTIPEMGRLKAIAALRHKAEPFKIVRQDTCGTGRIFRGTISRGNSGKGSLYSIRIYRPDGTEELRFKKNVRGSFTIPFLPSDPEGKWKCTARDVLTGITAKTYIEIY